MIQIISLSRNVLSRKIRTQVSPCLITLIRVSVKNCADKISEIKCGYTVHPQSCVEGNDFLILLNCEKLKFVSRTSNLLEQTYDSQKTHSAPTEVDFESSRSPAKSES